MICRANLTLLILCLCISTTHAATIQLPRTGQTLCNNAAGEVIACTNTGQDGDKLSGEPWPSPRFTDNNNGAITDNLTGLIWLKNANCFGAQDWPTALAKANTLAGNNTQCSLNDGSVSGDWRLPNIIELESLVDLSHVSPTLPSGHPFDSIQISGYYWSSSSYSYSANSAWSVGLNVGLLTYSNKADSFNGYVWPVRAGQ
jgi:hypothetical protein